MSEKYPEMSEKYPDTLYLDTEQASDMLNLKPATLANWRWRGDGPPYRKFGKSVRYHRGELLQWAEERDRAHTSEPPTQAAGQ